MQHPKKLRYKYLLVILILRNVKWILGTLQNETFAYILMLRCLGLIYIFYHQGNKMKSIWFSMALKSKHTSIMASTTFGFCNEAAISGLARILPTTSSGVKPICSVTMTKNQQPFHIENYIRAIWNVPILSLASYAEMKEVLNLNWNGYIYWRLIDWETWKPYRTAVLRHHCSCTSTYPIHHLHPCYF